MIDNTAHLKARIKMLRLKKQTIILEKKNISNDNSLCLSKFKFYNDQAHEIRCNITKLRDLVLDKKKDYLLCCNSLTSTYKHSNYMSDNDRKQFDADSDLAMKQCLKLLEFFETQVNSNKALRKQDEFIHLKTVAHLLSVYLNEVCRLIAQLRAIYLKKSEYVRKICRLANLVDMYEASIVEKAIPKQKLFEENEQKQIQLKAEKHKVQGVFETKNRQSLQLNSQNLKKTKICDVTKYKEASNVDLNSKTENFFCSDNNYSKNNNTINTDGWSDAVTDFLIDDKPKDLKLFEIKDQKAINLTNSNIQTFDELKFPLKIEFSKAEQEQLIIENRKLFDKISHSDEDIIAISQQLLEIQRLQNTFSEKVIEQERDIDSIHDQTIHTLDNLEMANQFIRQAIKNSASRRVISLFCLIVLAFTLLFLDWYNP